MRTISFSDARNAFKEVLDHVVEDDDITIITRRDAADVVIMSLATYNSWRETTYLLSSPANAQRLNESIAQARAGHVVYAPITRRESYAVHEPMPTYGAKPKPARKSSATRKPRKPR